MKRRNLLLCIIAVFIVLSACGKKDTEGKKYELDEPIALDKEPVNEVKQKAEDFDKPEKEIEEEVKALPQTLAELASLPPGHVDYVGILKEEEQKQMDELTKDLPDISGEPTEQQLDAYYNDLLAIFQQDFNGPEELIAELKFQSIGSPDIDNPRMQFKENLNVLVLLDASGSMNADLGGQTQMDAAKKAITNFVKGLPKEANVGLRVYGHKGTGSDSDKKLSCASSELIYPLAPFDQSAFQSSLDNAQPAGWTPIQLALDEAEKDLAPFKGEENTNIVYLVSDGISTCDDDPVAAAEALYHSDITPIVNVIGFNIDHEGQKQLKEVAKATEGTYQDVQNAETLQKELDQANEIAKAWADWKKNKTDRLEGEWTRNDLSIFVYDSREFKKWVDERQQVGFSLQYLFQTRQLMSRESHDYLEQKNRDYHVWIEEEYGKLKKELQELNDKKVDEAIRTLEEKYIENAPE